MSKSSIASPQCSQSCAIQHTHGIIYAALETLLDLKRDAIIQVKDALDVAQRRAETDRRRKDNFAGLETRGCERGVEGVCELGVGGVEDGYFDGNCGFHFGWESAVVVNEVIRCTERGSDSFK